MKNSKNIWTAEEGDAIMNYIIKGDSAEVAKAKVLIANDVKIGKLMAEMYEPNIMLTSKSSAYKALSESSVSNRKKMIEIYGEDNFRIYNMASKKNQINALVYGQRNPKVGFQLKKSKGCYGIEA